MRNIFHQTILSTELLRQNDEKETILLIVLSLW